MSFLYFTLPPCSVTIPARRTEAREVSGEEGLDQAAAGGSLPSQNPVVSLPVELWVDLYLPKLQFVHW